MLGGAPERRSPALVSPVNGQACVQTPAALVFLYTAYLPTTVTHRPTSGSLARSRIPMGAQTS